MECAEKPSDRRVKYMVRDFGGKPTQHVDSGREECLFQMRVVAQVHIKWRTVKLTTSIPLPLPSCDSESRRTTAGTAPILLGHRCRHQPPPSDRTNMAAVSRVLARSGYRHGRLANPRAEEA